MSNILVAGAGHGGVVAAMKLASCGHSVTIFEKNAKGEVGVPQTDAISKEAFGFADIPVPEGFPLGRNTLTFVPLNNVNPLTLPPGTEDSVITDRKALMEYLLYLAENSGVNIVYGCTVLSPIILGSRVCGLKTSDGEYYADMVIDACGVNSPVRNSLPQFMGVNREIKNYDILYSYRAYFKLNKNAPQPKTDYNLFLYEDGTEGFYWTITKDDKVDVLIVNFSPLTQNTVLQKLHKINQDNPFVSTEFLYGGNFSQIPVCNPLGILVADGYAAVGDSAFMTYAIKGSGVAYAFKAGHILYNVIENDKNGLYNTETLWGYQREFYKEVGFSACRIAIMKNILPFMTAKEVSELFESEILTSDDLNIITNVSGNIDTLLGASGRSAIKEKIKLLRENEKLKSKISMVASWIAKFVIVENYFPKEYSRKDAEKWLEKYNEFFDNIRKSDCNE